MSVAVVLMLAAAFLPSGHRTLGSPTPDPGQRYALSADAEFQEGCLDPCACPILLTDGLTGGFLLRSSGVDGRWALYELTGIDWEVFVFDDVPRRVTGGGFLRVDPVAREQRLVVDLSVDGEPAVPFDSGVVDFSTPLPAIDVTVARNGFFCWDQVFRVAAQPSGPIPVTTDLRWGTLKARFHP